MTSTYQTQWCNATNLYFRTDIDAARGVRVRCDQDLDDEPAGPVVTVGRCREGWEVSIRLHTGERVRLVAGDGPPVLTLTGDVTTFREMFDDDGDPWEGV